MFFWFLIAVGLVVALTLLGAFLSRHDTGDWERNEDRPIGPWSDM